MGTKVRLLAERYRHALRLRNAHYEDYADGAPPIRSVDRVLLDGAPAPQRWNLGALEAHVGRKLAEAPEKRERVEEWRYYLIYLRSYAALDGSLPASLDGLVTDVFGEAPVFALSA
jgi:hypothetical protein